jgi:hypothetical protein
MTGSNVPHWPDALSKLSKNMRREMVHQVAGAALAASQFFPDNAQLHLALYSSIQRHVFFTRESLSHVPCFVHAPHCTSSAVGDIIYRNGDACSRVYFVIEVLLYRVWSHWPLYSACLLTRLFLSSGAG